MPHESKRVLQTGVTAQGRREKSMSSDEVEREVSPSTPSTVGRVAGPRPFCSALPVTHVCSAGTPIWTCGSRTLSLGSPVTPCPSAVPRIVRTAPNCGGIDESLDRCHCLLLSSFTVPGNRSCEEQEPHHVGTRANSWRCGILVEPYESGCGLSKIPLLASSNQASCGWYMGRFRDTG
jgi:hypothetical protein